MIICESEDKALTTHEIVTLSANLPVLFSMPESSGHIVPNHWHTHVELLMIVHGTMEMLCNEKSYTLHEKDIFLVNSGDIHYTKTLGITRYLLLQIPFDLLNQGIDNFDSFRFQEYFPYERLREKPYFQQLTEHLMEMLALYQTKREGYPFLFDSKLNLLFYTLYTHCSIRQDSLLSEKATRTASRMKDIITYVEQHYADPLTLSEVAGHFALNPEYFCRYFKKNMGFTFLEHVNSVRLAHIYQDLLSSKESITELQGRHGFTNYKVFNRMFKEAYGCTPSQLRDSGKFK